MTAERRDEMLAAAESSDGFLLLREAVKRFLEEGVSEDALLGGWCE